MRGKIYFRAPTQATRAMKGIAPITRWFLQQQQQPPEPPSSSSESPATTDSTPQTKTKETPQTTFSSRNKNNNGTSSHAPPSSSPPPPPSSFIHLTPVQSCQIHGWLNPRRTLDWDSICSSPGITLKRCMQSGVSAASLKSLQPDVQMWVRHKNVTLSDVPWMLEWPLHPCYDLKANISDLATEHFSAEVMARLGITYEFLRTLMHMDDNWMRILRYTPHEWARMGFTREDALEMGRQRLQWVFPEEEFDGVLLKVSSVCDLLPPE